MCVHKTSLLLRPSWLIHLVLITYIYIRKTSVTSVTGPENKITITNWLWEQTLIWKKTSYSTWTLWRALLRSHWAADPVASRTYCSAAGTVLLSALLFQYFSWNFILSPLLTSIFLLALSTKAEYSQAVAFSTLWTTSPDMRCTKQYP